MVAKARALASHLLEVDEADLTQAGGRTVRGRGRARARDHVGRAGGRRERPGAAAGGHDARPVAAGRFRELESTFPFGAHVAVVEVDTQTGDARLVRHIAVDDCGRILNPMLVDGQVHGGLGQGIAQALYEEFVYDESGNPISGNLATYGMPAASELPRVRDRRIRRRRRR